MVVKEWMTENPITVGPDEGVSSAWRVLKDKRVRHLPVVEKGRLVGIVTDRNLREALPSPATSLAIYEVHYLLDRVKVREVMTRFVISAWPEMPIVEAARLMASHRIGCLPVLDGEKLVGIITQTDVLHAFVDLVSRRPAETAA